MRARLAFALLVIGCEPSTSSTLTGTSPLISTFESAGREHGVPPVVLASLAYAETGLQDRPAFETDPDAHVPVAYGLLGIPAHGRVRSVELGARLLGVDAALVKHDLDTNVRAAAAMLRAVAGDLPATAPIAAWASPIEQYLDAGPLAAQPVLALVSEGFVARDASGSLKVSPSGGVFGTTLRGLAGEYPGSNFVAASSDNYTNTSRTDADIDVVVIHTVQGSYAGCISWFQNPSASVSAHYVVRRSDGAITQMVRHEDRAWHAGNSEYNRRSIGIEHEGFIDRRDNYTDPMLESSAALVRWLATDLGIPLDRDHIVGHIEVPGATHTDPGPYWPWDRFMNLIADGSLEPPLPVSDQGVIQGVVYEGTNIDARIAGATVTLDPGGATATADAEGFWTFRVEPGTYTVNAEASGFVRGRTTRTVPAGGSVWGSVSVERAAASIGTLAGVVFDATHGADTRISGAEILVGQTGTRHTTQETGLFELELEAGAYQLTVTKEGFVDLTVSRSVSAGRVTWGSIGLVPVGSSMSNRAPEPPRLDEPVGGVTVRGVAPIFRVGALSDPEGDPLSVELEIFADTALIALVSKGSVSAGGGDSVAWRHPLSDLPRGVRLSWRARAKDASLASPWTAPETFMVPPDGKAPDPTQPWLATTITGLRLNQPPGAPRVRAPLDGVVVGLSHPEIVSDPADDPDGDELAYEFEVGLDDVFTLIESTSELVTPAATIRWRVVAPLAPGSTYYARVRAADDRVFGAWSPAISFTVADDAAPPDEGPGEIERDLGDGANDRRNAVRGGGCDCRTSSDPGRSFPWAILGALLLIRRRRR
ncbi:MAG: N-acetylmuramoyl-L-alanine amidase [Deltaproteobacteria bacterium]|nr:N-acetylmuramoyl-L-alanine amidase [Deltaproteobacteria bacterium]